MNCISLSNAHLSVCFLIEPGSSADKIYVLPVDQNGTEGEIARTEQEILPRSRREFNINARWASHLFQRETFTELRLAFRDARSKEMGINARFALARSIPTECPVWNKAQSPRPNVREIFSEQTAVPLFPRSVKGIAFFTQ